MNKGNFVNSDNCAAHFRSSDRSTFTADFIVRIDDIDELVASY
jgi:hypothetical protein